MFYVGQKVVCIDDSYPLGYDSEIKPLKDNIYTVREIKENGSLRLVEITNKPQCYMNGLTECWFKKYRFAPLETYGESYSIAIQLVQELEQVDKQKVFNPKKETV